MGMWDETCAITHLPIFPNDACVLVVADPKPLASPGARLTWVDLSVILAIEKGTYNAYGWLDDLEGEHDGRKLHLFFHRDVWDRIVERVDRAFLEPSRRFLKDPPDVDPAALLEFRKILQIASLTRRDVLVCQQFHGYQDLHTLASYELVHELTAQRLDAHRQRRRH